MKDMNLLRGVYTLHRRFDTICASDSFYTLLLEMEMVHNRVLEAEHMMFDYCIY